MGATYVTYPREGVNRIGESATINYGPIDRSPRKPVDYAKIVADGLAEHKARVAADPLYCSKGAKIHYE